MDFSAPLILQPGVEIAPLAALPTTLAARIAGDPGNFAVWRSRSRATSMVVDAVTAELLLRFRQALPIANAVVDHGEAHDLDPEALLRQVFPLLCRCVRKRFLGPADEPAPDPARPSLAAGDRFADVEISRCLQAMEDTEVYLARFPAAEAGKPRAAVLKLLRRGAAELVGRLDREAEILRQIPGEIAPRLLASGQAEGQRYLLLEHIPGVEVQRVAARLRTRSTAELIGLCSAIVRTYAHLSRSGIVHGDIRASNLLADRQGKVRLIDFGLARRLDEPQELASPPSFHMAPEQARAAAAGAAPAKIDEASEQYSIGVLLYRLITGALYLDFSLRRDEMLRQIIDDAPRPFRELDLAPWPELEAILERSLAKDPSERYPSLTALAQALAQVPVVAWQQSSEPTAALVMHSNKWLRSTSFEGTWLKDGLVTPPTASLTYGAAGVAFGLYRIASQRHDPDLLARADVWACRAEREAATEAGFQGQEIDIGPHNAGESSPYHAVSGVHAVQAWIARARCDRTAFHHAVAAFVETSGRRALGLDLTLGTSGTLLIAALIADGLEEGDAKRQLDELGSALFETLWRQLDAMPVIAEAPMVDLPGMAHGWAGFAYATLQWCRVRGVPPPASLASRLDQLVELSRAHGRGRYWPWRLSSSDVAAPSMPGWCNGSAGYVFLWTLAWRHFGETAYLDLAIAAGWDAWDAPERTASLCCGLAGRVYALLHLFKHTGENRWLTRARHLAQLTARAQSFDSRCPHSLYRGEWILAVLAADLECPETATMPFFEEETLVSGRSIDA